MSFQKEPPCIPYILSHLSDNDTSALAAFLLSYIQFLLHSGVTGYKEISNRIDMLSLVMQNDLVGRKEVLNPKAVKGVTYEIQSEADYTVYIKALYEACGENPKTFKELFCEYYPGKERLCGLCPYSTAYTQADERRELELAKYIFQDSNNYDYVREKGIPYRTLFRSCIDLYDVLPTGADSIVIPGLAILIETIGDSIVEYYYLNQCSSAFVNRLEEFGINAELLKENYATYTAMIYSFLRESIDNVTLMSNYNVDFEIAYLSDRKAYEPEYLADGSLLPYHMLKEATDLEDTRKEVGEDLNEIRVDHKKKNYVRRRKKTIEIVGAATLEEAVFDEFNEDIVPDVTVESEPADDDLLVERISENDIEVVTKDGLIADPNVIEETVDEDADETDEYEEDSTYTGFFRRSPVNDAADETFEYTERSEETEESAKTEETVSESETEPLSLSCKEEKTDTTPIRDYNQLLVCDEIADTKGFLVYDETISDPDKAAISNFFSTLGRCVAEPVVYGEQTMCVLYGKGKCYLLPLPLAYDVVCYKRIHVSSMKAYALYGAYGLLNNAEHNYIKKNKMSMVYPILDLFKMEQRPISCDDIPSDLLKRLSVTERYAKEYLARPLTQKAEALIHTVASLGYSLYRSRYLSTASSDLLFSIDKKGALAPRPGAGRLVLDEEHFSTFQMVYRDIGQMDAEDYAGLTYNLLQFMDLRGDARSLPYSVIDFHPDCGDLTIVTSRYCKDYVQTILSMYLDFLAHKQGIRNLKISFS